MNLFAKKTTGQWAEDLACAHLRKQGLKLLQHNYRYTNGEIDLIMQDKQTLVFIEVRYRANEQYGGSIESIDWRKQQRIIRTAQHYLQTHQSAQQQACRFDVVLLSGKTQLQWIADAFRPT